MNAKHPYCATIDISAHQHPLTICVHRNTYYLIGTAGLMFTAVWQMWAEAKPAHCKWITKEEKEFLEATVSLWVACGLYLLCWIPEALNLANSASVSSE